MTVPVQNLCEHGGYSDLPIAPALPGGWRALWMPRPGGGKHAVLACPHGNAFYSVCVQQVGVGSSGGNGKPGLSDALNAKYQIRTGIDDNAYNHAGMHICRRLKFIGYNTMESAMPEFLPDPGAFGGRNPSGNTEKMLYIQRINTGPRTADAAQGDPNAILNVWLGANQAFDLQGFQNNRSTPDWFNPNWYKSVLRYHSNFLYWAYYNGGDEVKNRAALNASDWFMGFMADDADFLVGMKNTHPHFGFIVATCNPDLSKNPFNYPYHDGSGDWAIPGAAGTKVYTKYAWRSFLAKRHGTFAAQTPTLSSSGLLAAFSAPHNLAVGDFLHATDGECAGSVRMVDAVPDPSHVTLDCAFALDLPAGTHFSKCSSPANALAALNTAWGTGGYYTAWGSTGTGWGGTGTGVLDMRGAAAEPWLHGVTNLSTLAGIPAAVADDISEFLFECGRQMMAPYMATKRLYWPNKLVFGPNPVYEGFYRPFLRGIGPWMDVCTGSSSQLLYDDIGKPTICYNIYSADRDSCINYAPWGPASTEVKTFPDFPTQEERGAAYALGLAKDQQFTSTNPVTLNDRPIVGMFLFEMSDHTIGGEVHGWSLIDLLDNIHDGKANRIAPGVDQWGYSTGGEKADMGDSVTAMREAHHQLPYRLIPDLQIPIKPTILSPATLNVKIGELVNFLIEAPAYPTAVITLAGALPGGLTFDGKTTITGRPTAGTAGSYPITITATNAQGSAVQTLTIDVVFALSAAMTWRGAIEDLVGRVTPGGDGKNDGVFAAILDAGAGPRSIVSVALIGKDRTWRTNPGLGEYLLGVASTPTGPVQALPVAWAEGQMRFFVGSDFILRAESDLFAGPDAPLAPPWIALQGAAAVVAHQGKTTSAGTVSYRRNIALDTANHRASLEAVDATTSGLSVKCRMDDKDQFEYSYDGQYSKANGGEARLRKIVNGVTTLVAGPVGLAAAGKNTLDISARDNSDGSVTVEFRIEGVLVFSYVDTVDPIKNRKMVGWGAGYSDAILANFQYGDLTPTPTPAYFGPGAAFTLEVTFSDGQKLTSGIVIGGGAPPPVPPAALLAGFSFPTAGATVSGIVAVSMTASGGVAPYVYALNIGGLAIPGTGPSFQWDTTQVPNGGHTLGLTVLDALGAVATASLSVTVQNVVTPPPPPPDTTVPTVSLSLPAVVYRRSTVDVLITASDNVAIAKVELYVNGALQGATVAPPYVIPWRIPNSPHKTYVLQAKATDTAGNPGVSAKVSVTPR